MGKTTPLQSSDLVNKSIKKLADEDYFQIEMEHASLEKLLNDLTDSCCNLHNQFGCQGCGEGKLAACRGRFPSFFHDLIEIVGNHFYHEETIMLNRPHVTEGYEYFRAHRAAHTNIMRSLSSLIGECSTLDKLGKTAESYRHFYNKLSTLLEEHNVAFDVPFIESTRNNTSPGNHHH
ncbi:MAG: hypothetical protein K8Q92_06610 [Methylophilales bacterium]|nr:hypothetical protein [Methylophilales bacterium]